MSEAADTDRAQVAKKLAELAELVRLWRSSYPARQYDDSVDPLRERLRQIKASANPWPPLLDPVFHRVEYIIEHTALAQQQAVEERALSAWWADLIAQADTASEHIKRLQVSMSDD